MIYTLFKENKSLHGLPASYSNGSSYISNSSTCSSASSDLNTGGNKTVTMTMMPLAKMKSDESNLMSSPPPKPLKTNLISSDFSSVSTLNKRYDLLNAMKQPHPTTFDEADDDQFENININAIILNRDEINKQTNANYSVNNSANHNKSLMRQANNNNNNNTFMDSPTRCVTVHIF